MVDKSKKANELMVRRCYLCRCTYKVELLSSVTIVGETGSFGLAIKDKPVCLECIRVLEAGRGISGG